MISVIIIRAPAQQAVCHFDSLSLFGLKATMINKNKKFGPALHGWVVLDKLLGLTSTQALGRVRRLVGGHKAGHGGTLDPLATGILPLAFGEATKTIPYIIDSDKIYEFTVRWGENRTTEDAEGAVTATSANRPTEAKIRAVLPQFTGEIQQIPPIFSAIKVQGERAYDLARAGEVVELAARAVMIYSFELTGQPDTDHAHFRVACGKGTYIRALARDLAAVLGTCGHVCALRRTKVGPFSLEKAISLPELEDLATQNNVSQAILPIKAGLEPILTLNLTSAEAHTLQLGQTVMIRPQHGAIFDHAVVFTEQNGVPVALVEPIAGELRVLRGFHF